MGACTKNDIGDKMIKFDKVFVITLESNPGRYKAFKKKLENIKFPQPHEKFYGIVENPPKWWRLSKGFWGCARSHRELWGRLAGSDWNNMLVFEDDAFFVDNFLERYNELQVPDDWDMFYLGGQPVKPGEYVTNRIMRCDNINLMHAYAVNKKCAQRLVEFYDSKNVSIAQDWRIGQLHPNIKAYLCMPNLVGQIAGISGTAGIYYQERIYI